MNKVTDNIKVQPSFFLYGAVDTFPSVFVANKTCNISGEVVSSPFVSEATESRCFSDPNKVSFV